MDNFDFLVVGQGLAGTILCHELEKAGYRFKVMDNRHHMASSLVAAGIVNPITGRRFVKSWMIDHLIPKAKSSYSELEQKLGDTFLFEQNINRVLFDEKAAIIWERVLLEDYTAPYIVEPPDISEYRKILNPIHDHCELTQSFRVLLTPLIIQYQAYLKSKDLLITSKFDFEDFNPNDSYTLAGDNFGQIIFAEGHACIHNPYFKYLPFFPAKGEAINFKLSGFTANKMLRHRQFIVPNQDGTFWSGGGYEWDELTDVPTEEFLDSWKKDMEAMINLKPEVIDHKAGVRPTVDDRRPCLGRHPNHPKLLFFNGMGTKGTSLAPYWASKFVTYLKTGELSKDVDINRFGLKTG